MSRIAKGNTAIRGDGTKPNGYFYSKDAMRQNIPMVPAPEPEDERRAGIVVVQNAVDQDEAIMFLQMLGLVHK
jgi:hypothetical protein